MTNGPLELRAFARRGLLSRVSPFAGVAVVVVTLALLDTGTSDQWWLAVATGLTIATIVSAVFIPWQRLPSWADVAPPIIYIVAVAALRHTTGGAATGYSPIFLVPVIWLALFGTRLQLMIGLLAVIAAMVAPIVLVGAPQYPTTEWRRVLIIAVVAGTLGLIVQRLVREAVAQTNHAVDQSLRLAEQKDITDAIVNAASDAVITIDATGVVIRANAEAAALFGRADPIGRNVFHDLVPEKETERLRAGLGRVLASSRASERDARFETELSKADGGSLPVEVTLARTDGPAGVRIHALVRDLTSRRAAEAAVLEHANDLERLLSVARGLGDRETDPKTAICQAARELIAADLVLFFIVDPDGQPLTLAASAGDEGAPGDLTLDATESVAAAAIKTGAPAFSGDLGTDPRVHRPTVQRLGMASAYWQPVVIHDQSVGVLIAYWRRPIASLPVRIPALLGLFAAEAGRALERSELLARLSGEALTDALTGVANRRALEDALRTALAEAKRSGQTVSVVMLDLDHFKRYNDEHGHQAGDGLLQAATSNWSGVLRPLDTLARYGGEEFVVVLPQADASAAIDVADRLRDILPGDQKASAGTATWDGDESAEALIGRADAALYAAKAGGRDRTVSSPLGDDPGRAD